MGWRPIVFNAACIDESFRIGKWNARERSPKATGINAQNQMPFIVIAIIFQVKGFNNRHDLFGVLKRIHDMNTGWQCGSVVFKDLIKTNGVVCKSHDTR